MSTSSLAMSTSSPVISSPTSSSGSAEESAQPLHGSMVLDLAELVEKYAMLVPFRMRIVNGFMAADNPTIVVDGIYSVHLVKEIKVVKIKSAVGEFTIPLHSTAKFGLIYDEHNEHVVFETVEELLHAKTLPKVVAVRNKYISPDGKVSLKKNEVLIVGEVIRTKIGRSKIALKFFSVLMQKEIALHKEHDVQFTTSPHITKLYLTDLIEYSTNFMPCSARIFLSDDSSVTGLLSSTSITLQNYGIYQSVIVSRFHGNPKSDHRMNSKFKFIDVPTSIKIDVRIIETREDNGVYQQIMEESKNLLQNYSQTKICMCLDAQTDDAYVTQAQLLTEIRKDMKKQNLAKFAPLHYQNFLHSEMKMEAHYVDGAVSMVTSPRKHQLSDPPQTNAKETTTKRSSEGTGYQPSDVREQTKNGNAVSFQSTISSELVATTTQKLKKPPPVAPKPKPLIYEELAPLPPPPATSTTSYEQVVNVNHNQTVLHPQQNSKLQQDGFCHAPPPRNSYMKFSSKASHPNEFYAEMTTDEISAQIKGMQDKLVKIVKQMDEVLMRQSHFEAELKALNRTGGNSNKKVQFVDRSMSPADILGVLDAIGLPQYKEAFAREAIDGELFSSLDDNMLAEELDVSSRIHRIRILKLMESGDTYMLMK